MSKVESPPEKSLESQILHAAVKSTSKNQQDEGIALLAEIMPEIPSDAATARELVPTLAALLRFDDDSVVEQACIGLERFGIEANSCVNELRDVAMTRWHWTAHTAMRVLAAIPTTESAIALIEVLENEQVTEQLKIAGLGALTRHGGRVGEEGLMPRVERALRVAFPYDSTRYDGNLDYLRLAARDARTEKWGTIDFPDQIDLTLLSSNPGLSVEEIFGQAFVQPRQMTESSIDERFRFVTEEGGGEIGISIRRYDLEQPHYLVILRTDEESYGVKASPHFCDIASAISSLYGIDATRTIWVDHHTAGSGLGLYDRDLTVKARAAVNLATGRVSNPRWERILCLTTAFEPTDWLA